MEGFVSIPILGHSNHCRGKAYFSPVHLAGQHTDKRSYQGVWRRILTSKSVPSFSLFVYLRGYKVSLLVEG